MPRTLAAHRAEATQGALRAAYAELHAAAAAPAAAAALTTLRPLDALLAALAAAPPGPLHGVPCVVKDNIDVAALPTTAGCARFAYVPPRSAVVVEALERAGAVVVGKATMDQFATGLVGTRNVFGVPENPCAAGWIPGGSSSGSAVAVASGLCVFALGTDTAGSGRVPAAMCGVVGVKPTRGLLSCTGVVPACESLDCVSVFAACVEDAHEIMQIAGRGVDELEPWRRLGVPDMRLESLNRPGGLRFGVPGAEGLVFCGDTRAESSFASAVAAVIGMGSQKVDVDFAPFSASAKLLYEGPFVAERFAAVGTFIKKHSVISPADFDPIVTKIILGGEGKSAADLFTAQTEIRRNMKIADRDVWSRVDFLLVPTIPRAYTIAEVEADPVTTNSILGTYTNFVNLMDYCAIAIPAPAGSRDDPVPRGITLIAPAFSDSFLARVARDIEEQFAALRSSAQDK